MQIHQMDVETTFPNGKLDEEISMQQPIISSASSTCSESSSSPVIRKVLHFNLNRNRITLASIRPRCAHDEKWTELNRHRLTLLGLSEWTGASREMRPVGF